LGVPAELPLVVARSGGPSGGQIALPVDDDPSAPRGVGGKGEVDSARYHAPLVADGEGNLHPALGCRASSLEHGVAEQAANDVGTRRGALLVEAMTLGQ